MQKQYYQHINKLLESEIDIAIRGRVRAILSELKLTKGDKVLDAGCGWGYYPKLISKLPVRGYKLIGVDLDKKSVLQAKQSVSSNANISIKVGNLEKLKFKDNTFDKIILSEVAEHLPKESRVFDELLRVLKPNGYILITVPNHNYPIFWDPVNWVLEHIFNTHVSKGFWAGIWTNHIRLYYPDELINKLTGSGFVINKQRSLTLLCLPFNKNLLYGGKLPPSVSKKFIQQIQSTQKPFWIQVLLFFVNVNDKLNQIFQTKDIGVSLFVKAYKNGEKNK